MNLPTIAAAVGFLGAVGGLLNCFLIGEFHSPRYDKKTRIWRPGWVGSVVVGLAAALLVWALYGPFADYDLLKQGNLGNFQLRLSELFGSIVVGMSGSHILASLAQRRSDQVAREQLIAVIAATQIEGK